MNHFLRRLRIEEIFGRIPTSGRRQKESDACVLMFLLRNLILSREPLYGLSQWAERFEGHLLGLPRGTSDLNDDRVGRVLDRLFDADRGALLTRCVLTMIREFSLALKEFHNDSTSIPLYGRYREATGRRVRGKATLVAENGHSKDHRPDLKQLLWVLTVSEDGAVPVHFKVTDGSCEDSTTHLETWQALRDLCGSAQFLYVADSKLCTRENLRAIEEAQGLFLTVLPRTRAEDAAFRDHLQTHTPAWHVVRQGDPASGTGEETIVGVESPIPDSDGYRLFWYRSSSKRERDAQARSDILHKARKGLEALAKKLASPKSRYKTEGAVAKVVETFLAASGASRWLAVTIQVTQQEKFRQENRGRPTQTTRWRRILKPRFHLELHLDTDKVAYDRNCDGIFPLLTNDHKASLHTALDAYKSNQPFVEKRHHYLKTVQAAVPVYLKSISRIEALFFLEFLALLVRALMEREIKRNMAKRECDSLPLYPEGRPCKAPTTERIFEILEDLEHHRLWEGPSLVQEFPPNLTKLQREVIQLLGLKSTAYR